MGGDLTDDGSDAGRWGTFRVERTVLAVTRTLTSAIRLLEALPVFAGDHRVRIVFAVDRRSRNSTGVAELIRGLPAKVHSVEDVTHDDWDLVVTASEKLDLVLDRPAPMLVLPHGIGFHKRVPDADSDDTRVSGVVAPEVLRGGQVRMLVTHPDHERRLAELCPETVGRTLLGGDTSLDLLLESAPLRARYREALGLRAGQRLVLVTSTWRGQSLLGTDPGLLADLVRELPADEYRVALVAHPNVWAWEGGWELRRVADTALRSGMLLVDPTRGWHAAMVAADVVIGDHGSVSLYAAATGVPLLLGAFGDEVVAGTAMAGLGRTAPRLDRSRPLLPQLEEVLAGHRTLVAASDVFTEPGQALRLLRTHCYDALGLPEPDFPQRPGLAPDPPAALPPLHSLDVVGTAAESLVTLRRHPVAARTSGGIRHVSVDVRERDVRRFADAAVVVRTDPAGPTWPAEALDRHPGARIAGMATPDGCVLAVRGSGRFTVKSDLPDPGLLASAVYTRLVHTGLVEGTFDLRVGADTTRITVY
ncbi:hypothetical protein GCM10022243_54330 [Saccharothrix violaceirubra]|uniref:Translation initiation factor 2 n=1 Tax=Saccharothrix violaceirubra TaxID=413306 RepID=A0A7W7WXC4_9PSEU|nr:hypothetical protein [Saccharothrix violaceirubra]MBB4966947.1 hypothetical protein [Saccharothrix violaceirubra]